MARAQALRKVGTIVAASLVIGPCMSHADVVTDWNVAALNATAVPPNSILQSRVLAIVHGAIYDAVRAVEGKGPAYAVDLEAAPGASVDAAVAAAAHGTLVRLVPAQRLALDTALGASLSRIAVGKSKSDGIDAGERIAERSVALRSADQSDAKVVFTPKAGAGLYQVTLPHSMAAILPQWGSVTPFVVRGRSGLAFKGPPPVTSEEFARDFEEVKAAGARNSTTRTADQTAAAVFWTVQTAVPWHAAARAASAARDLTVAQNARLFAILSMATADSQIIAFEEKYRNPHWRPITAIRGASTLGNPALKGDPQWEPLLGTPPHPEYPSAHAAFSGAAEAVLTKYFDTDSVHVVATFPPVFGVSRTYARFSQISEEVDNARVWGGIHFRSADTDGTAVGRKIGEIAMRDFPRPPESLAASPR